MVEPPHTGLKAWQRSAIRNTMANYRRAQENYYISGKPLVELEDGTKAFSLLTPPLGSLAARRRVRLIMGNMLQANAAAPTPVQFATAAISIAAFVPSVNELYIFALKSPLATSSSVQPKKPQTVSGVE